MLWSQTTVPTPVITVIKIIIGLNFNNLPINGLNMRLIQNSIAVTLLCINSTSEHTFLYVFYLIIAIVGIGHSIIC